MTLKQTLVDLVGAVEDERSTQCGANGNGEFLITRRRLIASSNTMWVYSCGWDEPIPMAEEVPVKVRVKGSQTPTEGRVVGCDHGGLWLGVRNNLGAVARPAYVHPDRHRLFCALTHRLHDIERNHISMRDRPFGRLFSNDLHVTSGENSSGIQVIDTTHAAARRDAVTQRVLEGLRGKERILLTSPHNRDLDESLIAIVRAMRMEGLSYSTLVTRYPALVLEGKGTTDLRELAFEQQLRTNAGKARTEQAMLQSAYHRYQKLAPSVAIAQEKAQDLTEVEALEDRLLREIDKFSRKDTDLGIQVETYAEMPLWRRLSLQVGGNNPRTMDKMRLWCAEQLAARRQELAALQPALSKAKKEAYLAPETWQEYEHIMDTFEARGGIENVRALITQDQAESGHGFQGRGLVAATAGCVASQDVFNAFPFDTVVVDGIDDVPLPLLLPVTYLARKNIVLVGNQLGTPSGTLEGNVHYLQARLSRLRTSVLTTYRTNIVAS